MGGRDVVAVAISKRILTVIREFFLQPKYDKSVFKIPFLYSNGAEDLWWVQRLLFEEGH